MWPNQGLPHERIMKMKIGGSAKSSGPRQLWKQVERGSSDTTKVSGCHLVHPPTFNIKKVHSTQLQGGGANCMTYGHEFRGGTVIITGC
jgi:hypothetical protein